MHRSPWLVLILGALASLPRVGFGEGLQLRHRLRRDHQQRGDRVDARRQGRAGDGRGLAKPPLRRTRRSPAPARRQGRRQHGPGEGARPQTGDALPLAGDLANDAFLRRPPPDGPGIRCSNIDVFSYGQVEVTSTRLTIALRDANGRTVKDPDGKDCGPYVVTRR
jgi:hypothetical protein